MDLKKFNEIIDYAIEREHEAIKFYQDLQNMAKFNAQKDLLKQFENMERGHVDILERIRSTDFEDIKVPQVTDLMISSYVVGSKPTAEMTYQDIITIAMKKEQAAHDLYTDMASKVENDDVKSLFLRLSAEEAKHKLHFETIYDTEILKDN
jgi:rubrerythrin